MPAKYRLRGRNGPSHKPAGKSQDKAVTRSSSNTTKAAPSARMVTTNMTTTKMTIEKGPQVGLFDLPREVRDKIYQHLIPKSCLMIKRNHPNKELQQLKKEDPRSKHKKPRTRLWSRTTSADPRPPLHLLRVCRQMTEDVIIWIYSETTINFSTINDIQKFIKVASPCGIQSIKNLGLSINAYGEPFLTKDRIYKIKFDRKFQKICKLIRKEVMSLTDLDLDFEIGDWPCNPSINQVWAQPILYLAGKGLKRVVVNLRSGWILDKQLTEVAKEMEQAMVTSLAQMVLESGRRESSLRKLAQERETRARALI